jgi:hypothetical protein
MLQQLLQLSPQLSPQLLQLSLQACNQCALICYNLLLSGRLPALGRNPLLLCSSLLLQCSNLLLLVEQQLLLLHGKCPLLSELQGQGVHGRARLGSSTLFQKL